MRPRIEISKHTMDLTRSTLRQSPDPPRPVSFMRLLFSILRTSSSVITLIFGAGCLFTAEYMTSSWLQSGETVGIYTIVPFVFLMGILIFLAPTRCALAYYAALRHGVIARTTVESITFQPVTNKTFAGMKNGLALGVRRVHSGSRSFQERFQIDQPFAEDIRVGTTLLTILDPHGKTSVIELGPEE